MGDAASVGTDASCVGHGNGDSQMRFPLGRLMLLLALVTTAHQRNDVRAAEQDIVATEMAKLEGTWLLVSRENNGVVVSPNEMTQFKPVRMTIKKKYLKIVYEKEEARASISIDLSKSPRHFDIKRSSADPHTITVMGIYSLDGKSLKICSDSSGKTRPSDFKSKEDSPISVEVWKRE